MALALVALALIVLPVAAAEPPAGVLLDATVVVAVREPSPDGGVTAGPPLADAAVTVVAYVTDFDDPLQVLTGTSDATGRLVLTDVARPGAGGPPVFLAIEALREVVTTDAIGCVVTRRWFGLVTDLPTAAGVSVEVARSSSEPACPPEHEVRGTIRGPDGSALDPVFASVSIVLPPDGGAQSFPLAVGADGSFSQPLPGWGTVEDPALVSLEFVSAPTRFEPFGSDCLRTFAQRVAWSGEYALSEGESPAVLALVTEEFVVGEQCGATGGGGHSLEPPLAGFTLPPTDAAGAAGGRGHATSGTLVGLVALLLVFGAAVAFWSTEARRRV